MTWWEIWRGFGGNAPVGPLCHEVKTTKGWGERMDMIMEDYGYFDLRSGGYGDLETLERFKGYQ
jgi:hypothetical protein